VRGGGLLSLVCTTGLGWLTGRQIPAPSASPSRVFQPATLYQAFPNSKSLAAASSLPLESQTQQTPIERPSTATNPKAGTDYLATRGVTDGNT
jgi:hypothetical protein